MTTSKKVTLLNSSILTTYGNFSYRRVSLAYARRVVQSAEAVQSAIGHASTAAILTELLEFTVEQNRIEYQQQPGETALVFKLRGRPPEGTILSRDEIEEIGYDFAIVDRVR